MIDHNLEKNGDEIHIFALSTSEFLVPLKIGTPPVPQILIMDTGSLLFGVHCGPTIGGEGSPGPLYKYAESSSYVEDVFCDTPVCDFMMLNGKCGRSRRCDYTYKYGSALTDGNLASEVVTFDSRNGTEVTIKHLMFGCSSKYSKGADHCSGILGLGQRAISLISQQNYTGFSYCIGNINDKYYDTNTLVLGGQPIIIAASTPMFMVIGKYYITLEKISVGDKFLDIDPNIFKRVDYEGGMLVDSGATSTYLPDVAFNKLTEEIRSVIGKTLEEYISSRPGELCYLGNIIEDLKNLPTIAFHFVENAKMKFVAENLFFQQDKPDHFCILGVWAQQFYYIAKINCDRLSSCFEHARSNTLIIPCNFL